MRARGGRTWGICFASITVRREKCCSLAHMTPPPRPAPPVAMKTLDSYVERTPLQNALIYGLMTQEAHETALRIIARLEVLYAQFPSPELGDAILKLKSWHDGLGRHQPKAR
jgi:hypothetical protein